MMEYRGFLIDHDGMAWVEILILAVVVFVFLMAKKIFRGTSFSFTDVFAGGFLAWLQINIILFAIAFSLVPAYLTSGGLLIALSVFSDQPIREFVREHFITAFIPTYLLSIGVGAAYFRKS